MVGPSGFLLWASFSTEPLRFSSLSARNPAPVSNFVLTVAERAAWPHRALWNQLSGQLRMPVRQPSLPAALSYFPWVSHSASHSVLVSSPFPLPPTLHASFHAPNIQTFHRTLSLIPWILYIGINLSITLGEQRKGRQIWGQGWVTLISLVWRSRIALLWFSVCALLSLVTFLIGTGTAGKQTCNILEWNCRVSLLLREEASGHISMAEQESSGLQGLLSTLQVRGLWTTWRDPCWLAFSLSFFHFFSFNHESSMEESALI